MLSCTICHVLSNEIKQDEAQDRFVDLSVDVSYGLPQLGYVYNGLHLRGPRSRDARKARQGFSHHVQHPDQGNVARLQILAEICNRILCTKYLVITNPGSGSPGPQSAGGVWAEERRFLL